MEVKFWRLPSSRFGRRQSFEAADGAARRAEGSLHSEKGRSFYLIF
jgi:hypothetical protein